MVDMKRMKEQLLLHEGLRLEAYLDTEDYWTVGVGFNLSARGIEELSRIIGREVPGPIEKVRITKDEAMRALEHDILEVQARCRRRLQLFDSLSEVRQRVVVDMAFNMGSRALQFKNAIEAAKRRDWSRVARELYKSKWANQVDDGEGGRFGRADRLVHMVLTDQDYTR